MIQFTKKSLLFAVTFALTACNSIQGEPTKLKSISKNSDFSVQLIGGPTTLLKYGDLTIITDPTFDPAGGKYDIKIAILEKTDDPAFLPKDLPEIDVVLLSHDQHADNLDNAGRALLEHSGIILTTGDAAGRTKGNVVGLDWWETYKIGDVTITAVPAQHGPAPAVPIVGPVIGFIISSETGPTVYISGDTVPFSGTDAIIERYAGKIDYTLLHTGAVVEGEGESLTYFSMQASEAVDLAAQLDAKAFSIIHADSWVHFSEKMPAALDVVLSSTVASRMIDLSDNKPVKF